MGPDSRVVVLSAQELIRLERLSLGMSYAIELMRNRRKTADLRVPHWTPQLKVSIEESNSFSKHDNPRATGFPCSL